MERRPCNGNAACLLMERDRERDGTAGGNMERNCKTRQERDGTAGGTDRFDSKNGYGGQVMQRDIPVLSRVNRETIGHALAHFFLLRRHIIKA